MTQAAANLVISPASYNLAKAAGSLSAENLSVKLNNVKDITDDVTVIIPTTPTDATAWLKYNATAHKFEAKTQNDESDPRSATVTIQYGTLTKTVTVTQAKD